MKNAGDYIIRRKGEDRMEIRFGDVVWVDFGENSIGSVQKGKRPAVVIQNDIGNKFSPTSIVVPITSAIKKLNMPCHKLLRCTKENGLIENSMILGEQVQVISKTDIITLNDYECKLVLDAYFSNVPRNLKVRA